MSLETDLMTYLEAQGLACSDRIYPVQLPQAPTLPALVYAQVSVVAADVAHDGQPAYELGRYQFDCYAEKYGDAKALALALKSTLRNWGAYETYFENLLDLSEYELDRYRMTVEFLIGGAQWL